MFIIITLCLPCWIVTKICGVAHRLLFWCSRVIWLWMWFCDLSIMRTHTHTHIYIIFKPSPVMLVLMPWEVHGNYPYRPLQRYRSHGLSAKGFNHNANKGKLSRLMEVMFHVLFLLPLALGEKKKKREIQLLAQTALIVSSPNRVLSKATGKRQAVSTSKIIVCSENVGNTFV